MDLEFPNISTFTDSSDLFYILFGILTIDVIVLFLARNFKIGGKYLNEWYDNFHILAVISDVFIIFIGFIIARFLYTKFFFNRFGWNVVYFLLLLVGVQAIHDVLFYLLVIRNVPAGKNDMMDTFKSYADNLGAQIIGGDALLMVGSAVVAMLYKMAPFELSSSVIALVVYALPYAIYTRNPYSVVEEQPKKEEKKEAFQDPKLDAYKRMVHVD